MAKQHKYEELSSEIIQLVGGKDNISFFTHCMTRLRFNLKDRGIVDVEKIDKVNGVIRAQWSNDQLQIVVGQDVSEAYKLICEKTGLVKEETVNENLDGEKKKFSIGQIFDAISGSIAPLIPMMIGGGMIKVIALVLTMLGWLDPESSTTAVINFAGDAAFYFLPIFLGATAAKKFNTNQGLGMFMGAILIHPNFVALVAAGNPIDLFGLPITLSSYGSTVIPIIMVVWIMSYVQRFFAKISPNAVRSIVEPLGTMIVMIPLALCVVGPLGVILGNYLSIAIVFIYETTGFIGVGLLAAILPLLVMTGMHAALTPYWVGSMSTLGYEPFFLVAMIISNLNQGAATAAVAIRAKGTNLKSTAASCAVTAIVGGVTEPAMFGITLKYKKPLYAAMIGSFCGGAYAGLMKVYCYAFPGSGGLFALPSFIGPTPANIINMIIGVAIGMAVTFVLTLIIGFEEE